MMLAGGKIPEKTIQRMMNAPDFKQFLEELHNIPEYQTIRDSIGTIEQTNSLSHLIRTLEKDHLTQATKKSYLHPLSILPILDYFIRKRIEVENLTDPRPRQKKKDSQSRLSEKCLVIQ